MEQSEPSSEPGGEQPREEAGRSRIEGATEVLRRVFYTGLGALFATEEGLRKATGELPKEVAQYLAGQAQHTKDEVVRILSSELRRFLDHVDVTEALRRALASLTVEIKTEIRFLPGDAAARPEVKRRVSVRRRREDEPEGDPDP